jgi:hypothetical protein
MMMRGRLIGVVLLAAALLAGIGVVGLVSPAFADYVYCPPNGAPCYVIVTTGGSGGGNGNGGGGGGGGGNSGPTTCQYKNEIQVPCFDPDKGWYNSLDGCYYKVDTEVNKILGRPGNYEILCGPGPVGGCDCYVLIGSLFFPNPPPGFGGPPNPAVLAAQAINALPIRSPLIGIAPSQAGAGLVGLPVWMWTEVTPETWGPISATAAVPGLSVTATANATKIDWTMGDGQSITCANPGTPYEARFGNTSSPTCGYRYGTTSAQHGGRFTITAITTWHIHWAGGGQEGDLDVTRPATIATIEIDELQVVTGG